MRATKPGHVLAGSQPKTKIMKTRKEILEERILENELKIEKMEAEGATFYGNSKLELLCRNLHQLKTELKNHRS